MNNTMVRKFCTLKEAAEQLAATQEQIEHLLRKGILREFRDGSHRLLRAADVAAIVAARVPMQKPASSRFGKRSAPSRGRSAARRRTQPQTASQRPGLSIREWFWIGLTQDRPITLALLCGFLLLMLSAVVAGACMLAGIL